MKLCVLFFIAKTLSIIYLVVTRSFPPENEIDPEKCVHVLKNRKVMYGVMRGRSLPGRGNLEAKFSTKFLIIKLRASIFRRPSEFSFLWMGD